MRKSECGRSIVEMLGVLAIMGVITVMGIAGYSQAVARINRSRFASDIMNMAQEIRTLYAGKGSYSGLNTGTLFALMGNFPTENPFGGVYEVGSDLQANEGPPGAFYIFSSNLSKSDCDALKNMRWDGLFDKNGAPVNAPIVGNNWLALSDFGAPCIDSGTNGANALWFLFR